MPSHTPGERRRSSRKTQPLRKSRKRRQTAALSNAQRGAPQNMRNPQDVRRKLAKAFNKRKRRKS